MRDLFVDEGTIFSWDAPLRLSSPFPLMTLFFILGLIISAFVLPVAYSYEETCPKCQGNGKVTCEDCNGSGTCWVCGGTGKIWYMPESSNWCAACQGTGRCRVCDGKGWYTCTRCFGRGLVTYWMYTQVGSAIVLSIISVFLFLTLFGLSYIFDSFYLGFNDWVYEVGDMGFWFNLSFMTWLFARHPKRWAKWQTCLNLIATVYVGVFVFWLMFMKQISTGSLLWSSLVGGVVASSFAFLFYNAYVSRIRGPL
jgi:hypothetical protein